MDLNNLTLGEVARIEEISGLPMAAMADEAQPKGKQLAAVAFVLMKRDDKTYTMKQAEELTMAEVMELLGKASEKK